MKQAITRGGIIVFFVVSISVSSMPIVVSDNGCLGIFGGTLDEIKGEQSFFPSIAQQRKTPITQDAESTIFHSQLIQHDFFHREMFRTQLLKGTLQKTQGDGCSDHLASFERAWASLKNDGNYTPHKPIKINKNADFTPQNGVVSGNGTVNDPYIIEGWIINTTNPTGIEIRHTTAYFMVRHCLVPNEEGIFFYDIENGQVVETILNCSGQGVGIYLSSNVSINDSMIYAGFGVYSQSSVHLLVENCNIFSSSIFAKGVSLASSSSAVLSNLTVFDNNYGIYLADSPNNIIRECDVFSNEYGLFIIDSPYQVFRQNSFHDNTVNLGLIYGFSIEGFYLDIDTSNTVNGKPIYYLRNESNMVFDENDDIGFLGLVNCNNIIIDSINLENNDIGVLFVGTEHSSITSTEFIQNPDGLVLFYSSNNSIDGCDFTIQE